MAIAKNLVELMGGDIVCESKLGVGTTFTVTMHMKIAAQASETEGAAHRERTCAPGTEADGQIVDLTGKRLLLVEDNAINREIARRIISETKAEVVEAHNGKEAVEVFAAQPANFFDLILMDIQMPVMNGYEATVGIRALGRPDAAAVLIYAMTANTFDEDVRQVKDAGMNGHIGKPYTPDTLYRVLAQALSTQKS